jgi:E3 ubiquitin-protein ligase Topors
MSGSSYACPPTPERLPTSATPPPASELTSKSLDSPPTARKNKRRSSAKMASGRGCSSPEPTCSICLGELENMSCTDSCLHKFCFTCLLEWSKVKPECPLCKAKFQSIIHTIESDEDYQSYQLPPRPPSVPMPAIIPLDPVPFDQRFRYRPGMPTVMRARHQHQLDMAGAMAPFILPSRPPPAQSLQLPSLSLPGTSTVFSHGPMWHRRRGRATSEFRHDVYERNLYVDGGSVVDVTGRFRECSPEWFRNNEASTHRLVPWLNREMNVLLF